MKEAKPFKLVTEIPWCRLQDLVITALEGGSNYWYLLGENATAIIKRYKGLYDSQVHGPKENFFYSTLSEAVLVAVKKGRVIPIHDTEGPDGEPIGFLSTSRIQEGIDKMAKDHRPELEFLLSCDTDYDASDADVIFQYLVLGEIVYG